MKARVKPHNVKLTEQVSATIEALIANGRYKDFSAAIQDAAWHHFGDVPNVFAEYGVTPEEVERSARRDLARVKAGKSKPWKPQTL